MFACLDDTIVAISSAVGRSPRGILRLSGPTAHRLAGQVFQADDGVPLEEAGGHRRVDGRVWIGSDADLPAEVYSFRAPASYTRQDLVEIHTIGSPPVLGALLERLTGLGARSAEPGEFTARAFFAGAMDLTSVEGVAAMIDAHNDAQLRASEALLHGRLGRQTSALREQVADLLALVEADIDFVEEPIEFISPAQVGEALEPIAETLSHMVRQAPSVERLEVLARVLLTGPPNVGKSTLFNALTGMDRVIQSSVAGTTRDVISTPLKLADGEVQLLDSPGLDMFPVGGQGMVSDSPGALAQEHARGYLRTADLLVVVADIDSSPDEVLCPIGELMRRRNWCLVLNKIDCTEAGQASAWMARARSRAPVVICTSAHTGEGVDRLKSHLNKVLFTSDERATKDMLALSSRQRAALQEALQAVEAALTWCRDTFKGNGADTELLALHLREGVHALSVLEGRITTDDLLDRVFSRFCVGK